MIPVPASLAPMRRFLRRKRRAGLPIILMYHRIGDTAGEASSDPWGSAVSPARFAQHLDILRRRRVVLSLRQLAARLAAGTLPHNGVVVTFDDGYADNLHAAKPLLETHDVPATVFAVASAIGRPTGFWWDELAAILLRPGALPPTLRLETGGTTQGWDLGAAAHLTAADAEACRDWRGWQPPPTPRHALFLSLWRWLRERPDTQRLESLDALRAWAGDGARPAASPRPLTGEELVRLAEGGLVEIGAHTATHAPLPRLGAALRDREVAGSKASLEARLGHEVRAFSYPHGEHDAASIASVRQAGFACACITGETHVRRHTDPLCLPRIQADDWDGEEFERRLSQEFIA
ncbi:polysaccharide deacetylase family protein [Aquabacter sp. CN5-332]|uniref:polysaccharide deacetylase family protein n=1 Tax=Aquabacter sp. CN5-332 TaxID=3156608 RepID=UPI0032B53124